MEEEPVLRKKAETTDNDRANSKSVFADRSKMFGGRSAGRPVSSFIGGGNVSMCSACNKRVYPMELMKVNDKKYHKFCFKCNKCKRTLSVGNFTVDVKNNDLYCKPHFIQLFRTKGNYDDGFKEHASSSNAGDTSAAHENGGKSGEKKTNGQVNGKASDELVDKSKKDEGDTKTPEDPKLTESTDDPSGPSAKETSGEPEVKSVDTAL